MKPSDRISAAVDEEHTRWRAHNAKLVPVSAINSKRIDEIVLILDEMHGPELTRPIERLTRVVDLFDDMPPRERMTIMALLSERYNSAGDRR